ncbi:MAG: diguanylate cyclase domain-containing protein, partial [Myxococcota bacterium]
DTVARVGGDEFVVLLTGVHDRETAERLSAKIERSFDAPFPVAGVEFRLGASAGVSLFPDDATDSQGLTNAADLAMYRAKEERAARDSSRPRPARP